MATKYFVSARYEFDNFDDTAAKVKEIESAGGKFESIYSFEQNDLPNAPTTAQVTTGELAPATPDASAPVGGEASA